MSATSDHTLSADLTSAFGGNRGATDGPAAESGEDICVEDRKDSVLDLTSLRSADPQTHANSFVVTGGGPPQLPAVPLHRRTSKRFLDVAGALLALLGFLPVLAIVTVCVWAHDRGPVLFRQVRVGAEGREFKVLKFRSMRPDAESVLRADPELYARYLANNCKLEAHEDPRLTGLGRFIRATSLDELPQFWNVLKGDMSLVGPRPVLPWELEDKYGELRHHYVHARPGITGPWQVSGRSTVGYDQRVMLDTSYIADWRLSKDLRILARTPFAVMTRDGAY